ncbi:L,D-transpeptidase [Actinophytocola gossypii]|uniref:L,D-transpeptidase family protein n=1 Tax=Actinophytocola gossypii TaxID=2812003 RepID=A0ABT2JEC4_9PSEU|nr:Ig-like domain-containing protein [Actinophytocola gossypii]MCT2585775.1 L,D-transpeptidase family protein [Actinophytocola gossypii]
MKARSRWVLVAAGLVAALGLTACSSDTSGTPAAPATGAHSPTAQAAPKPSAAVAYTPTAGATDVNPVAPVSVKVTDGTIQSLTLTNPAGEKVIGKLSADHTTWNVGEPLGFGKTYTWSGTALGADGATKPIAGEFTTVTPNGTIGTRINTGDGKTYGVAMPIAVTFDAPVDDKAAAERAMTVRTSVPVEGSWAWLDDTRAHWRPKTYWPAGTEVHVNLKLYGVHYGDGIYGADDMTADFSIGRKQVVKANTQTHRLKVYRDGKLTADFPASFGMESDPGRVTNSGTHVVMSMHESYSMTNPQYDYYDVVVPWAVRISNNGEFVHGYAPSVWAQGSQNVSHGCVNLSPADAKKYFDSALVGDPVEITGSDKQLDAADGDYYDWTVPWDEWKSMSALAQ